LEQQLRGISVNRRQRKTAVVAYADDIAIFVTQPEEVTAIGDALTCYEHANGAMLNFAKSQTLAVGTWNTTRSVLNILYSAEIKILGHCMANTTAQPLMSCWSRIINMVRTQAHEAYSRDLDLAQRIQYVHTYLLANLWLTAQVLPAPSENVRQIVSAIAWYIWQGAIFRVPISTLQRRKEKDGWGLTDVEAKCRALLLYEMLTKNHRDGEITAEWQRYWNLKEKRGNPSHVQRIPKRLEYLRIYALEMAYVEPPKQTEAPRALRRRFTRRMHHAALVDNRLG
jgi:hypothetical protein